MWSLDLFLQREVQSGTAWPVLRGAGGNRAAHGTLGWGWGWLNSPFWLDFQITVERPTQHLTWTPSSTFVLQLAQPQGNGIILPSESQFSKTFGNMGTTTTFWFYMSLSKQLKLQEIIKKSAQIPGTLTNLSHAVSSVRLLSRQC